MKKDNLKILLVGFDVSENRDIESNLKTAGYASIDFSDDIEKTDFSLTNHHPHIIISKIQNPEDIILQKAESFFNEHDIFFIFSVTNKKLKIANEYIFIIDSFENTEQLDWLLQLIYYKQKFIREYRKNENRENKLNRKLKKEIKSREFYVKQILRSKQIYYSSFNSLENAVFVVDPELNIILENKALHDFKKRVNIIESTLGNTVDIFSKHLDGFGQVDYIIMFKSGEEITNDVVELTDDYIVEIKKKPIFDEDKKVLRVMTIITDITAQIKAERHIKLQNNKISDSLTQHKLLSSISLIFNSIEDFETRLNESIELLGTNLETDRIVIYQENRGLNQIIDICQWKNSESKSLLGKAVEFDITHWNSIKNELAAKEFLDLNDIKRLDVDSEKILETWESKSVLLFPFVDNNEIFGCLRIDDYYLDRKWNIQELELFKTFSSIITHAFQRKNMVDKIIESDQTTTAIINSIPDRLIHFNSDYNILNFKDSRSNKDLNQIIINKSIRDNFPENVAKIFENSLDICLKFGSRLAEYEQEISGTINYFEVRFERINSFEAVALVRNVTERKIYEETLKEAKENAENANKAKNRLFSIISHDVRAPLADLKSLLDLLLVDINRISKEDLLLCFNEIRDTTEASFNMLQNLLQWSRNEMQSIQYNPVEFKLAEVINSSINVFKQSALKKKLELIAECDENLAVNADKDMTDTIVRNLVSNALKFSNSNSKILISAKKTDNDIVVSVQDFGAGICEENKQKIFSKSEIVTTRGTNNEKGTGVGLDLCRDFAIKNKGKLWFESEEGKGSTFYFNIPV